MTDFLKKTVNERRDEFDAYPADLDMDWRTIEEKMDEKVSAPVRTVYAGWWKVAATIMLAGTLTLMWLKVTETEKEVVGPSLSMVSPEMAETEQYYAMMISEKMNEIKASNRQIDPEVIEDLTVLDQVYSELREDLGDNVDNEEVINAMIVNYKIKLEVLDRILAQIKEAKNESHEKSSSL